VDPSVIEDRWAVERVVAALRRHPGNPVLRGDRPWEPTGVYMGGTVLRDPADGLFKCWYSVFDPEQYRAGFKPWSYNIAYAQSADGVHWEKPALGLFAHKGRKDTNIIRLGKDRIQGIDVELHPKPRDENERFICVYLDVGGVYLAHSRDGLDWRRYRRPAILPYHSDTHNNFVRDGSRRRWLLYSRPRAYAGPSNRRLAVCESPDLRHWSAQRIVFAPDERDPAHFYGMTVFRHGNLFFGSLQVFDEATDDITLQLAWSEDGFRWERLPDRPLFVQPGPEGAFDAHMISLADRPVVVSDELRFYYSGWSGLHAEWGREAAIGLLTTPLDRLVGVRASGPEPGLLLSRPFEHNGRALRLNAEIGGEIRAALRTIENKPIAGRDLDDCQAVTGNGLALPVRWKTRLRSRVAGQARQQSGGQVRLAFRLSDATLYSFSWA
jgi:hypothetical protein